MLHDFISNQTSVILPVAKQNKSNFSLNVRVSKCCKWTMQSDSRRPFPFSSFYVGALSFFNTHHSLACSIYCSISECNLISKGRESNIDAGK
ncbi:hypothetical protein XELAEV_18024015mg [Xenopus laevis]|uniref:Uncharacterized protein n=1 Tax=Xenopus laevis TaxID=8355 RepID=A0A974HQ59_XENLA|nr:hypothetical protein XELAEV_18024015mg [Xenopus laevis]